jgi:hypothetical protein
MGFEKGHTKSGGRAKGSLNQTTRELRLILKGIIQSEFEVLPTLIKDIKTPEKRLDILIKLLPFAIPKAQEISLELLSDTKLDYILERLSDEETGEN